MRLWNLIASLGLSALGLTAGRLADKLGSEESSMPDGPARDLAVLSLLLGSAILIILAVAMLFFRPRHLKKSARLARRFPYETARVGDEPDVLFE